MFGFDVAEQRVLVTGGAGFVGSHLVDALIARGAHVTIIDDLSSGFVEFVNPRAEFVHASLFDAPALGAALVGAECVFHFAANADVRHGLRHPRKDIEQNLLGTQELLEAMRARAVRRIAFASTSAVYGEPSEIPTGELAPFPVQTSLYGASKLASEGLLCAYAHGYGMQVCIFRFVSMLGPRYTHGHVYDFWRQLKANPSRLDVLGDGRQRKSYLHVADAVRAVLLIVERAPEPISIFNVGHHATLEVRESVRAICDFYGLDPELRYLGGERGWVGDAPRVELDTTRLRQHGWRPQHELTAAVHATLAFLDDNAYCGRRS
jgi:UDP-glucose 4-epimerase